MMYFSYTCLAVFLLSKFLIKKCTAGEYCVHLLKRDDVVYNVYTHGSGLWEEGEWIPRNQGVSGTNRNKTVISRPQVISTKHIVIHLYFIPHVNRCFCNEYWYAFCVQEGFMKDFVVPADCYQREGIEFNLCKVECQS